MPSPYVTSTSLPATNKSPNSLGNNVIPIKAGNHKTTAADTARINLYTSYAASGEGTYTEDGTFKTAYYPQCAVHHAPFATGFPSVTLAATTNELHHLDIHSLKFAVNSLSQNWSRGNDQINVPEVRITAEAGQLVKASDWEKIRNSLRAFGQTVEKPTLFSASYHNELVQAYVNKSNDCLCNSDCACNSVCACNSDCGCNYSDIRLKRNIEFIKTIELDGVDVNWYSFYYKDVLDLPKEKQYGVMAQELIESGLGQYVQKLSNGYYQVDYSKINQDM